MGLSIKKLIADSREAGSFASSMRRRRHKVFNRLLESTPRPLTILDLGGTAAFWKMLGFPNGSVKIILMNLQAEAVDDPRFESVAGDARDLRAFGDRSVDIVFSNSVIEHVGDFADQQRMAEEICRVAERYFVQTPNAYFPIEPHFLVPGFQFMPLNVRAFLLTKFHLGWMPRQPNFARAREAAASVQLLTPTQFRRLFPKAMYYEERLFGLTKSMVAFHGW